MVANKLLTLAFVREASRILLGYKKRGFGEGRWNGFGGKVQPGESIPCAAIRELREESGLEAQGVSPVGLLMFEFEGNPQLLEVHVFTVDAYTGVPVETEEMRPQWYPLDAIPFKHMWTDDELWFPHLLNCKPFYGYFTFKDMVNISSYELKEVQDLNQVQIPQAPRGA